MFPQNKIDQFWALVNKDSDCWIMARQKIQLHISGLPATTPARMAFMLSTGQDPGFRQVRASCKTPGCVNPKHLYLSDKRAAAKSSYGQASSLREERFWNKVHKTSGCWLWTGTKLPNGFGIFTLAAGRNVYANRYSYELTKGAIPIGCPVRHTCGNSSCVNPDHLEAKQTLYSQKEMQERKQAKSEARKLLTAEKNAAIDAALSKNMITTSEVLDQLGISKEWLRRLIQRGELPVGLSLTNETWYPKADVDALHRKRLSKLAASLNPKKKKRS